MAWIELEQGLPVQFIVVDWKHTGELGHRGTITKISTKMVEIHSEILPSPLANLRISLYDPDDHEITTTFTAKWWLTSPNPPGLPGPFHFRTPEAEAFLAEFLGAVLN